YHIGASGIVYGLVAFLFFSGLFRKDTRSIAIALIVIFLYGGMFYGIIPSDPRISWESHLMGSFTGIFCAFYFRNAPIPGMAITPAEDDIEEEPDLNPSEGSSSKNISTWSNSSDNQNIEFCYTYKEKDDEE